MTGSHPNLTRLALGSVVLLAFGLRVYRLDGQSLWADEGASVVMTYRSAAEIVQAAAGDIHPPLYYLALAAWSQIAGRSEFGLRFYSVLLGVLVIPLTYRLGARLLDRPAALLGVLFVAGSPLLIYYSQEARMYEQMALLGLAAIVFGLESTNVSRFTLHSSLFTLHSSLFAAAVLTQYFGVAAFVGGSLAFVLLAPWPWRAPNVWLRWMGMQATGVALVVPWLVYASGQLGSWTVEAATLGITEFADRTLRVMSFGLAWDQTVTGKTLALVSGLLASSLLWPLLGEDRAARSRRLFAIAGIALAAPLVLFAVSINRPVFNPKFLLVSLPAFGLLEGVAVASIAEIVRRLARPRRIALVAAGLVAVVVVGAGTFAVGRALAASYHDPKYFRDDYRSLAGQITLLGRPGDVIVLNAPGQREIFEYYYSGPIPVVGLPAQRPAVDDRTRADLEQLVSRYRRVWLVLWASEQSDPRGVVETWLNGATFRAANRWFGAVRLVQYSVPVQSDAGAIQFPEQSRFETGIDLLGYSLATPESRPGEALQLTLFWKPERTVAGRYTVFTHLIDRAELIWGQRDSEPVSGGRPTDGWQPGETIADRYGIPVLLGTPPGQYFVEVGLYRAGDGQRLGVLDASGRANADRVLMGPVTIGRPEKQPTVSQMQVPKQLDLRQGSLRLVGYDFHRLGFDSGVVDFRTGDQGHLTLFVQADERPERDRQLRIVIHDSGGVARLDQRVDPTNGLAPVSGWLPGDLVRLQHKVPLGLPPGRYRLLSAFEGETLVDLGTFEVR